MASTWMRFINTEVGPAPIVPYDDDTAEYVALFAISTPEERVLVESLRARLTRLLVDRLTPEASLVATNFRITQMPTAVEIYLVPFTLDEIKASAAAIAQRGHAGPSDFRDFALAGGVVTRFTDRTPAYPHAVWEAAYVPLGPTVTISASGDPAKGVLITMRMDTDHFDSKAFEFILQSFTLVSQ